MLQKQRCFFATDVADTTACSRRRRKLQWAAVQLGRRGGQGNWLQLGLSLFQLPLHLQLSLTLLGNLMLKLLGSGLQSAASLSQTSCRCSSGTGELELREFLQLAVDCPLQHCVQRLEALYLALQFHAVCLHLGHQGLCFWQLSACIGGQHGSLNHAPGCANATLFYSLQYARCCAEHQRCTSQVHACRCICQHKPHLQTCVVEML